MAVSRANKRPQLHQSHLSMLWRCGIQYERRYVRGEVIPPGVAMLIGSAVDHVVGQNLSRKADEGELYPLGAIKDMARDSFVNLWDTQGVRLMPEEQDMSLSKIRGRSIDVSVSLSAYQAKRQAPYLRPAPSSSGGQNGVHWKWVIKLEGQPFDLAGEVDLREEFSNPSGREIHTIRDLKTRSKPLTQREADTSEQLSMYALAEKLYTGALPDAVYLDGIIKPPAGPRLDSKKSRRDSQDIQVMLARVEQAIKIIQSGIFTPASQSDWFCNEAYCGYAKTCPYFRGRKTISVEGYGNAKATKRFKT